MSDEFSDVSQDAGAELSYEPSEPTYREPPQSWQRDIAERHWNALPDDLRGYLHTRETQAHSKIAELGRRVSELDGASTRYQSIDGVFQRYQQYIPEGLEREQAIASMFEAHRLLADPQTRAQTMAQMFEAYGVSNPLDVLPQYRQQFEATQRELQGAKQADVQRTLDEFTRDKTYYPEIRDAVIQEIVELRKQAPGLDHGTVLRLAHDRVVDRTGIKSRLDMEAKAKELAENQKQEAERQKAQREENDRRVKAARRAAGINVRSSPASSSAPKTMDDELRDIARRHYG